MKNLSDIIERGLLGLLAVIFLLGLLQGGAWATGIKVVPSAYEVKPGDDLYIDIIADNIPDAGLGTVQFNLNIDALGGNVEGVVDISDTSPADVSISTPLLQSSATEVRSGMGDFFLDAAGSHGILVMDNEELSAGSALYTYGHTNGAVLPSGSGSLARFVMHVGDDVMAKEITIMLAEVMLLDGGAEYPLEYNVGATITLILDDTPPETMIGIAAPKYDSEGTSYVTSLAAITLAATDDISGVASTEYRLDGGGWQIYQPFTLSNEGSHTIGYRSTDSFGNIEDEKTLTVIVDDTPSVSTIDVTGDTFVSDDKTYVTSTSEVTVDAIDNLSGVALVEYKVDGEVWADYTAPFSIDGDGEHLVVYRSTDNLGNVELEKIFTVVVDDIAPVSAINAGTPSYTASDDTLYITTATVLTLSPLDNGSGIAINEYRIDGGQWQVYEPFTVQGEGSHTIGYRSIDNLGNVEAEKTLEVILDITPPETTVSIGSPLYQSGDLHYVTSGAEFTLTAKDVLSGLAIIEYRIDGGERNSYAPFTIAEEGDYLIEYRSTDNLGNLEDEKLLIAVVDNTAPITTMMVGSSAYTDQEGAVYATSETTFTLTAEDGSSGLDGSEYRIDGGDWTAYAPFTIPAEGTHVVAYRSIDNVGNLEVEKILDVTIDNTPPVTSLTIGEPRYDDAGGDVYVTSNTLFTLVAEDNLSSVASMEYRIDEGEWLSYAPFTIKGEGSHTIEFKSIDNVSNAEGVNTVGVIVDDTAPVTAIEVGTEKHLDGEDLYVTSSTELTLEATDMSSGVSVISHRVDDGEWLAYQSFTIEGEGAHTIGYRSTDNLGNVEIEKTLTVIVDNTSSISTIDVIDITGDMFVFDNKTYVTSAAEFTLSATDNLSGVALVEYKLDSGVWVEYTEPFSIEGDGNHTVTYRSTDNLGNLEEEKTFTVIVDDTPPYSMLGVGESKYIVGDDNYVTSLTPFTITSGDDLSGISGIKYRIDGDEWQAYIYNTSFTIEGEGERKIEYMAWDNLGNGEPVKTLTVIVDNTAPAVVVNVGEPNYYDNDNLYATPETTYSITALDDLSGVASVEYAVDGEDLKEYATEVFAMEGEGTHTIDTKGMDNLGNTSEELFLVMIDDTAPETTATYSGINYESGSIVLVALSTEVLLTATDNLSGVGKTYYRYDEDTSLYEYGSAVSLAVLTPGAHTITYYSVDNLGNIEGEKVITFLLIGIDIDVSVVTVPRALIWVSDPSSGASKPAYTLDDIKGFIEASLGGDGIYYSVVSDKAAFKDAFRSGIYNVAAIIDQESPFDTIFIREMREAVNNGMGLMVSGWGNSVGPHISDVLGIKFSGSQSMDTDNKTVYMYESPISSSERYVVSTGRVLDTENISGTLAGIVKGEYTCSGIKGLTLNYPINVVEGDSVRATLTIGKGRTATIVDEEYSYIGSLPMGEVDSSGGNSYGDISIDEITTEGVSLTLKPFDTYLEAEYYLEVLIERQGSRDITTRTIKVTPTCSANLAEGAAIGPFTVDGVSMDYQTVDGGSGDIPAAVLSSYGKGKALFLAYNLLESAIYNDSAAYGEILSNAVSYLTPVDEGFKAGGVHLVETTVTVEGIDVDIKTREVLGEGLIYMPLFDLDYPSLDFELHLADGESVSYRYFMRVSEERGEYTKTTDTAVKVDGSYVPFGAHVEVVAVPDDRSALQEKVRELLEELRGLYPESAESINAILEDLTVLGLMTTATKDDAAVVIHHSVQLIHAMEMLGIDTAELRDVMDEYLRIAGVIYTLTE